jgi:hypothetical protein
MLSKVHLENESTSYYMKLQALSENLLSVRGTVNKEVQCRLFSG